MGGQEGQEMKKSTIIHYIIQQPIPWITCFLSSRKSHIMQIRALLFFSHQSLVIYIKKTSWNVFERCATNDRHSHRKFTHVQVFFTEWAPLIRRRVDILCAQVFVFIFSSQKYHGLEFNWNRSLLHPEFSSLSSIINVH